MKSMQTRAVRLAVLLALATGVGACMDAGSSPLAPERPSASLIGGTLSIVEGTLEVAGGLVDETVGLFGGAVAIPGGHALHLPLGALVSPTSIEARARTDMVGVDFGPHGLQFSPLSKPTLTLSFAQLGELPDEEALALRIVYLGEGGEILEVLDTEVDLERRVVRARIGHFSTYVLATD